MRLSKFGKKRIDFMATVTGSHEQARYTHVTHSGSHSEYKIRLILPARGAGHVRKHGINWELPANESAVLLTQLEVRAVD